MVNDAFEANDYRDVPDLLKRVGGKPRYIPPKQELLKYADPDYYERTPEASLMRHYLLQDADLEPDLAEGVLSELHFAIVLEAKPVQLLDILRDYEVPLLGDHMQIVLDILSGWPTARGSGPTTALRECNCLSGTSASTSEGCRARR